MREIHGDAKRKMEERKEKSEMKRETEQDKDEQRRLKKRDQSNIASHKVLCWLTTVGGLGLVAFMIGIYVVNVVRGTATRQQLIYCCAAVSGVVVVALAVWLIRNWENRVFRRDIALDPATMALPARGTVTLNGALHKMTMPVGAIVWVVIWGGLLFSMLFMLGDAAHRAATVRNLAVMAVLMAGGYPLLYLLWRKKSFVQKMIQHSAQFFPTEVHDGYADSVAASLQRGVLAYERELILTDDYLLGALGTGEWDTRYEPIAVPRARVSEYVFYYKRMVTGRISRTVGILACKTSDGTPINIFLGQVPKTQKVLRILDYYQIPRTEKEIIYQ